MIIIRHTPTEKREYFWKRAKFMVGGLLAVCVFGALLAGAIFTFAVLAVGFAVFGAVLFAIGAVTTFFHYRSFLALRMSQGLTKEQAKAEWRVRWFVR